VQVRRVGLVGARRCCRHHASDSGDSMRDLLRCLAEKREEREGYIYARWCGLRARILGAVASVPEPDSSGTMGALTCGPRLSVARSGRRRTALGARG
jgi:hypothetical protein